MKNELLYLSGNDIPIPEHQIIIHQPTIREIAYINEFNFFAGCELLGLSKQSLLFKDKSLLEKQTDFDIIMSIIKNKNDINAQKQTEGVFLILTLLFPEYQIDIQSNKIVFIKEQEENQQEYFELNNETYPLFKEHLLGMFNLKQQKQYDDYNPQGAMAKKIAEKLRKGKEKTQQLKSEQMQDISVLSRYVSVLAVGQKKDMNTILNYTVFQLYDEYNRFILKQQSDTYLQAKMAGAQNLGEIQDWTADLYSLDNDFI